MKNFEKITRNKMFSKFPFIVLLILINFLSGAYAQNADALFSKTTNARLSANVKEYNPDKFNYCISSTSVNLESSISTLKTASAEWQINTTILNDVSDFTAKTIDITFICKSGFSKNTNLTVCLNFDNWSAENYVLMPGSVYNGNRFQYRRIPYSPKLMDPRDIGVNMPPIISDVPKLNWDKGPSFIQERSGSMSVPSIGFYQPEKHKGFWLLSNQGNNYGDYGLSIEENRDRTSCEISISSPLVRELYKYRITDNRYPSNDVPANFNAGDTLRIQFKVYSFESSALQTFFDKFSVLRKNIAKVSPLSNTLPFSEAFETIKTKFNTSNYVKDFGYYAVGLQENFLQDWQIGWTGGMISTYPLLSAGDAETKVRVIKNFDWLFPNGISPSGFFYDSGEKGTKWYGGDIRKPTSQNWHLIRKSGDGLYYIIKQFFLMQNTGIPVKDNWKKGTKTVSDAFVKLWRENGQLGQFIDSNTGKIAVGGSTSGAITPGALCLAYNFYHDKEYLQTATEVGEYYYTNFVKKGISNGGPGDALQNPDSESCYALIESFTTLYETTHDKKWLTYAQNTTRQFSTWVMAYNYKFPANSLFGKLGIESKGAVFANAQNKHGAPAICTFSGQALLKLFRATGDPLYRELLNDIVHNMPQYLSYPLRPIPNMKTGWMNERVNTTDWLEEIGEIAYNTTWVETSMMLVYTEIPGLYVQPDKDTFVAFDNIDATLVKNTPRFIKVKISNPTKASAVISVLSENKNELTKNLEDNMMKKLQKITLKAKESKTLTFYKK